MNPFIHRYWYDQISQAIMLAYLARDKELTQAEKVRFIRGYEDDQNTPLHLCSELFFVKNLYEELKHDDL